MSEPFIGEVKLFGFSFPPSGYAECDGQTLSIAQNTALFSLLGTMYGGDGESTFKIPDLRGRAPIHNGQGPGLPNYAVGTSGGSESTTLSIDNLPEHDHTAQLNAADDNAVEVDPIGAGLGVAREDTYVNAELNTVMQAGSVTTGTTGGGQSFTNMSPYLAMTWCIALTGIFPSQ